MSSLMVLLLFAGLIWFWLDSARARELAIGICQEACKQRELQFLDQTVALSRLGLRWTDRGLRLRRRFRFEYSEEGVGRHTGHVTLVGIGLEEFSLGLPSQADNVIPLRKKPPH
jgi:hypothetical protein